MMVPDKFWQISGPLCVLVEAYENAVEGHNLVRLYIQIQCDCMTLEKLKISMDITLLEQTPLTPVFGL